MPQSATNPQALNLVDSHELREITELLVKYHGLHEGLYDLVVEFQIGIGGVGVDPSSIVPGAVLGVRRIGITKTDREGAATVDAAKVNPSSNVKNKKTAAKKVVRK